jgi:predicted CoA-binding protein
LCWWKKLAEAPDDDALRAVFAQTRVIAVVGMSDDPAKPSHYVAAYLAAQGFRVIPVNPALAGQTMLGETVRAGLADIPADIAVDMVDLFRRSEQVPPVVDEAIAHLPALKTVWMQVGIAHEGAAAAARAHGLTVVQNRCTKVEHARLMRG